jgi:hypothetical protein
LDVLNANTVGGANCKANVVGTAGQHPNDRKAYEPRDQRAQGISADAISPLHVVNGDQQALPVGKPGEMVGDSIDKQQRLGRQLANLLEFRRRQKGLGTGA